MWIRLLKSHAIGAKTFPIGRVIKVTSNYGQKLISDGIANEYKGQFPPQKMKTDFFKPK